jgi:hypothetical protein
VVPSLRFSYPEAKFFAPESSHFTSGFRATRINLRRLSSLPLPSARALSACFFVISDSGQSWETRAGIIPSLPAISAHERTRHSLICAAQERTFHTTDQESVALQKSGRFSAANIVDLLAEYFPFSKGIETRIILFPIPPRAPSSINRLGESVQTWKIIGPFLVYFSNASIKWLQTAEIFRIKGFSG